MSWETKLWSYVKNHMKMTFTSYNLQNTLVNRQGTAFRLQWCTTHDNTHIELCSTRISVHDCCRGCSFFFFVSVPSATAAVTSSPHFFNCNCCCHLFFLSFFLFFLFLLIFHLLLSNLPPISPPPPLIFLILPILHYDSTILCYLIF